jgi:hypothetical protein
MLPSKLDCSRNGIRKTKSSASTFRHDNHLLEVQVYHLHHVLQPPSEVL